MRILLVNWARIWDGATQGGGVNGYVQALALALVARGHDVIALHAGVGYVPVTVNGRVSADPGPCEVRRHPDWLGVRVLEIINSPVIAPAFKQFRDPAAEIADPALDRVFASLMAMLKPDVVHFHNIEGLTARCIHAAIDAGARTFYSLHNYHTICPQAYLMRGHTAPCFDSRNGHACVGCIEDPPDPGAAKREAAATSVETAPEPPPPAPVPWPREILSAWLFPRLDRSPERQSRVRAIGSPVSAPEHLSGPHPAEPDDTRGITRYLCGKAGGPDIPWIGHDQWVPLSNHPTPEPPSELVPNDYGRRRAAMLAALNRCHGVFAVSRFVRDKFVALGLDPSRVSTQHIGTAMNQVAERHRDLLWDPPPIDPDHPRPIRLVFFGFNNFYKGLHMFADALELLTPEYLARLHVSIFGYAVPNGDWRFRRIEGRLAGLLTHPTYGPWDIPWMLGGKDLAVIPPVWWDNAPQTVFESFACGVPVLGADLGGIPDFVRHGENGLLFRGNDRFDLARTLAGLIRTPKRLAELRRGVRRPKDIAAHASELETVYASGLAAERADGPPDGGGAIGVRDVVSGIDGASSGVGRVGRPGGG